MQKGRRVRSLLFELMIAVDELISDDKEPPPKKDERKVRARKIGHLRLIRGGKGD